MNLPANTTLECVGKLLASKIIEWVVVTARQSRTILALFVSDGVDNHQVDDIAVVIGVGTAFCRFKGLSDIEVINDTLV